MPSRLGGDAAGIATNDGVVGEELVDRAHDDLRLERRIHPRAARFHEFMPLLHACLRGGEEPAIRFLFQKGQ